MGFLEEIAQVRPPSRCQIAAILREHPDRAADIQEAIDSTFSSSSICKVLADHNIKIHVSALRRHRRRECSCHL